MIQQRHMTLIGRAGLALIGAGAATMIATSAPAVAEPASGTGSGSGTECSTVAGGGASTGGEASGSNGFTTPDTGGSDCAQNGIAPGGPAYNGVDPRG